MSAPSMSDPSMNDWLRDPTPSAGRTAIRTAADRLRSLAIATLRLEASEIADDDLAGVLAHLQRAQAGLAALPSIPPDATPAGPVAAPTFLSERSPVSGCANPAAAPLAMEHLPGRTRGIATYSEIHEGPSGHVHGGVIAATFDELLGVAQVHSGAAGYTVELTVRYRRLTPLFEPVVHEARVVGREDRIIRVEATSFRATEPDVVLASAIGTFRSQAHLPIPEHLHAN